MPALLAALRTTSHSIFAVIPLPQTRPVLLIDRKIAASVMPQASFHSSIAAFTHAGIGTVPMCPAFPIMSAITQRSSRNCVASTRRAGSSPRPHPISVARKQPHSARLRSKKWGLPYSQSMFGCGIRHSS